MTKAKQYPSQEHLQSIFYYDVECGDLIWKEPSKLSVTDYNTGLSFSDISNIIFRGGIVNVPGGTGIGEAVTGVNPTVTVWIPAPDYVDYFSPTLNSGSSTRFISTPTSNTYSSLNIPEPCTFTTLLFFIFIYLLNYYHIPKHFHNAHYIHNRFLNLRPSLLHSSYFFY